jgi:hypothetical protein
MYPFISQVVFVKNFPESLNRVGVKIPQGFIKVKKYVPVGFLFHSQTKNLGSANLGYWTS